MKIEGREAWELVVVSDLHYMPGARGEPPHTRRRGELVLELVQRALVWAREVAGTRTLVVLGDLVDDGEHPAAREALEEIREVLHDSEVDVFVIAGNHDGPAERVIDVFGTEPGGVEVDGCGLFFFFDRYAEDDRAFRDGAVMEMLRAFGEECGGPLVAFQHNPVHPAIESEYPYNITDADGVMTHYERSGVDLSVSGHYHPGIEPEERGGVRYVTAPALCEEPFCFLHLRIAPGDVEVREISLAET